MAETTTTGSVTKICVLSVTSQAYPEIVTPCLRNVEVFHQPFFRLIEPRFPIVIRQRQEIIDE